MAKLILSLDNAFLSEYLLDQERVTIGRRTTNDVHIDNLAVSGEHAAIIKLGNDFYIEDLESTNGTLVNSKAIKKHLLQHGDLVEFGKYQLKYISEAVPANHAVGAGEDDFEKTMIIRPAAMKAMEQKPAEAPVAVAKVAPSTPVSPIAVNRPAATPAVAPNTPAPSIGEITGKIQVLNGSSSGRELVLNKALTTLGKPGVQVAVITKRPSGYFITHVEGQVFPIVNGASTGAQAFALNDHDVIELAGVKMEFYLSKS
jgi:hypothetical protein